jgi:hypothetical protein
MKTLWKTAAVALLCGPLSAMAQEKPADKDKDNEPKEMHRTVIYQGPYRSVQYVARNADEEAYALQRTRADNEAALATDVSALKLQYVRGELMLDAMRRPLQERLYGVSTETTNSSSLAYGYGGGGYGSSGYGFSPYYGWGYGGYGPYYNGSLSSTSTTSWSLANGVGDEGPFKREFARVIAAQSYSGSLTARADAAVGRGRETPAGLGKKKLIATLTMKAGKDIKGELLDNSDPDWVILRDGKAELRVRRSEVVTERVEEAEGVKPAGN